MNTSKNAGCYTKRNKALLFFISCLAYATIGFHFSIRSNIAGNLEGIFSTIDPLRAAEMLGDVLGVAFLGYGITIFIVSPLIDAIGMGILMRLSGTLVFLGSIIVLYSASLTSGSLFWVMWAGMLLVGLGWGLVDTNTNPLVAGLYPKERTHKLNVIHAWWPAGIVFGGLSGLALGALDASWKIKLTAAMIPAAILAIMCFFAKFPLTERAAAGVSFGDMFRELFRRPMFLVWFFCIWFTATAELLPGQWVDMALTRTVGIRGIWLLIYVSGLMFVMRHFAGTLVHKLSPVGLLWISCLLTAIGLYVLSIASNPLTGFLGATLWGIGVCYMWPTMLATVNDRYPRSGALGMGVMGFGAMLAIWFFMPVMGKVYDTAKIKAAGGADAFNALTGDALNNVLVVASQTSFRAVAALPLGLLVIFGIIWIYDYKKGVKVEILDVPVEKGETE
jgi:MFS family permease